MFYVCSCVDVTLRSVMLFSRLDAPHQCSEHLSHLAPQRHKVTPPKYIYIEAVKTAFFPRWELRSQPHMFVFSNRSMNTPSRLTAYPLPSNLPTWMSRSPLFWMKL